ncbi:Uncharacterized membrane protein [Devosia enhydra]|uniref:Uncharacterized membrane protein n=1 Tax=Devosia enhydra TaxID=665118 RepID=A0A1K2HZM2_9HYPH|nr:alpha/beta-hydrolase family protein [Devosia enhydra]SFZ85528.1 Uncharacterized membrane protein [Devosia enhydra]
MAAGAPFSSRLLRALDRQPTTGLLLGLVLFSLSLTPSLLPRHYVLQGLLSGCVFAAGYGIGVFIEWLWAYLGFSITQTRVTRLARLVLVAGGVILASVFLWHSTGWQNVTRAVMDMPPVESQQPLWVAAIAVLPASLLIALGTLIVAGVRVVSRWLMRLVPKRAAMVGGMIVVGALFATAVDGVLLRWTLAAADRFYADLDRLSGIYEAPPADPARSGSAASLIDWDTIGRDARVYVQSGPTRDEIAALAGSAMAPLRIYVGLRSAETVEGRAALALAEMDRVGAFERSVLVLIMPVGTGWVDPPAIDTLEVLHRGDVASVAVQYSYLTSWLSLVSEPDVGVATAQALFSAVYARWTAMPPEARPKLYLHGLSLGAYSSQASATLYEILGDPFHGALWVGPPFASPNWRNLVTTRNPDSPRWLPRIGDGSAVRFANHDTLRDADATGWGPVRILYLQYPSDPIVFFEPALLYRQPEWLRGPRAPDVAARLNWYPVVTFFQLALDMALAQTSPIGFGHVYAPTDYLDAWVALTDPPGWTPEALARLRQGFAREGDRTLIEAGWFRR